MAESLGLDYSVIAKAAIIPALLYFLGIWFSVDFVARKNGLRGLTREELLRLQAPDDGKGLSGSAIGNIIITLSSGFTPSRAALGASAWPL